MKLTVLATLIVTASILAAPALAETPYSPPAPAAMGSADQFGAFVDLLHKYLNLVNGFNDLAKDPAACGVAAVIGAKELLDKQGKEPGIKYFTELLGEVKNPTVQRAIRLQLVEMYKAAGQDEQALGQLRLLMTSAPAE
jgi:hypothetical protein